MNFCVLNLALIVSILSLTCTAEGSEELLDLTRRLADAVNGFAFKLHSALSREKGNNFVISPVGIANTLSVFQFGARGKTAQELEHVLGYEHANLTRSMTAKAFRYLHWGLLSSGKSLFAICPYLIDFVDYIFANKFLGVSPSYVRRVYEFYSVQVKPINFLTDAEESLETMNSWARFITKDRIMKVEDSMQFAKDIVSVCVAYFKGAWEHPFSAANTKKRIFYNEGKVRKSVKMMELTGNFLYGKPSGTSMLELPIKGNNMSAVFLLPREKQGLVDIERRINQYDFIRYRLLLRERRVTVTIPKFELTFLEDLTENIQSLGINQLFQDEKANLVGIFPQQCEGCGVRMGQIKHSTFLEVNEHGIETITSTNEPTVEVFVEDSKVFLADHPFLFGIIDKRTGMLMFLGRVWIL